jgi:hypothetical protein
MNRLSKGGKKLLSGRGQNKQPTDKETHKTSTPEVPFWWYLVCSVLALFLCILGVEYWGVELRWYGVLLSCAVALIFYTPVFLNPHISLFRSSQFNALYS